jgi:hypothetical protein
MPNKKVPYQCPRCGFTSDRKDNVRQHFGKKKLCPALDNDIELSDVIKEYVLNNRIYKIEEVKQPTQIINNYNTMNNYIANIEPCTKLNDFISYKQIELLPFERTVEERFSSTRKKLEQGKGNHEYTIEDIFELIDNVTRVNNGNFNDFNIMYDANDKKLRLYESGDWQEYFTNKGMRMIVQYMQDYLLHQYECFLIRKIEKGANAFQKTELKNMLRDYYKFLAVVDVKPYVHERNNNQILYNSDTDEYWDGPSDFCNLEAHSLSDTYMTLYTNVKDNLTNREKDCQKKELLDLLKRNTQRNINELNKSMLSLINVDDEFKQKVLKQE